jgi:hypothetical protein
VKEVLSLFLVGILALCFVVFFANLKPDVVIAATGPSKPGYCDTQAFLDPRLPIARRCRSVVA